jgi:pimeloyl-ACP methyl ester carboxylesterase
LLSKECKLILFHSNFWEDELERKENRNRVIEVVQENKALFVRQAIPNLFSEEFRQESFVSELIEEAKKISAKTIILYSKLMRDRPSNEMYVKELRTNFLFIQGLNDQIIPFQLANIYLNDINFKITNAGHMGHFEARVEEINIIFNFF